MTDSDTPGTDADETSTDTAAEQDKLGDDNTIPNHPEGLAVGHDPDGSHFNPEEDTE